MEPKVPYLCSINILYYFLSNQLNFQAKKFNVQKYSHLGKMQKKTVKICIQFLVIFTNNQNQVYKQHEERFYGPVVILNGLLIL